jgi:hypothetical protein
MYSLVISKLFTEQQNSTEENEPTAVYGLTIWEGEDRLDGEDGEIEREDFLLSDISTFCEFWKVFEGLENSFDPSPIRLRALKVED